jgi:hypothetical protein
MSEMLRSLGMPDSAWLQLRNAIGGPKQLRQKLINAWITLSTTFNRKERRRRLEYLLNQQIIERIPTEWQIWLGAYDMMVGYIIPSNTEFYQHYQQNQYWLQFLRLLDEPSSMMDPTGLAASRDMIILHILHVVHVSAGYDVALLHMFPDGINELERHLQDYADGKHPRQEAIAAVLEQPDYPERLLQALQLYKSDPKKHWRVKTYDPPEGCEELLEFGLERYGTLGRLLNHAVTLPVSPWASFKKRLGFVPVSQT